MKSFDVNIWLLIDLKKMWQINNCLKISSNDYTVQTQTSVQVLSLDNWFYSRQSDRVGHCKLSLFYLHLHNLTSEYTLKF